MSYEHIDAARMTALARELAGDLAASLRFIDDFLQAWETRRRRVQHGVAAACSTVSPPRTRSTTLSRPC